MRVLLTGGGTAGHVNPALAIADMIREREPDSVIEYIGTEKGIEAKLVGLRKFAFHPIRVRGFSRSLSPTNVKALFQAFRAVGECKKLIRDFRPDIVIGTGGYVCWAPVKAAASLGVPTALHESNAEPGFAVRTLVSKADLILVNFEGTKDFLRDKKTRVERVGMPVNKAFTKGVKQGSLPKISALTAKPAKEKREKRILSFGGSLGAHTLNQTALCLARGYLKNHPDVVLEHACGAREYEDICRICAAEGLDRLPNLKLSEYIYDMPQRMANADLVICRSGASTLAELATSGKAAILIPSPNVTGDQQRKNAAQLAEKGAAEVLEDGEACDKIVPLVDSLFSSAGEERLVGMRKKVADFAVPDCGERLYRALRNLIDGN